MGLLDLLKTRKTKEMTIGILGEVNAGKTTLANKIGLEFAGQEMGTVSEVPHETREVSELRNIDFRTKSRRLALNLVDTPGVSTTVDYREFLGHGMTRKEAVNRAKEATQGVVKAIQSLNTMDAAIVVVDAARQPFNQVNWTIMGNLESRKVPVIVVANKMDLPDSDVGLVEEVFQSRVVPISALRGEGLDALYDAIGRVS